MPDTTPDAQTVSNTPPAQSDQPGYASQGVSTPPNGGDVSTVSPPVPSDTDASTPDATQQPSQQQTQPSQQTQQTQQPGTVSNTPPAPAAPVHPLVQKASLISDVAQMLAGGPRFKTSIDANTGQTTRTPVPLSNRQVAMAIALSALSGGIAGMSARGPGAVGQAGALGLAQGQQIAANRQAQQQDEDAAAQQGFKNQQTTLAQKASIAESNSRTILNTSEAESRGADMLSKLAASNKDLIDSYDNAGALQQRGVTQAELADGMKDGRFNATEMLGPIDGYRLDENGRPEATHSLITNPTAKLPISTDQWNAFADAGVPGWQRVSGIPDGTKVSGAALASANEIKNAMTLAQARQDEVAKALKGSDNPDVQKLAANVPTIKSLMADPQTSAGLATALERFQKYVSHSDQHGMDLSQSLQQMAQPSIPDGKGGMVPNPDAKYAQQVAQAFGGMNVLQAYHNEVMPLGIKNPDEAADMLASNPAGSRAYNYAKVWNRNHSQQEAREAGAKTYAEESVKASITANSTGDVFAKPDALGYVPPAMPGGIKEYLKRTDSYKKQADDLAKTEGTYQQFNDALDAINKGNFSGARSVVALFDAIGISATPLAGKGFRVNQSTVKEHTDARGWQQAIQAKLLNAKAGDVITPQQVRDYASIAAQARQSQYTNLANQVHNSGLNADFVLPTGNGQKIDPGTAQIFLSLTGNDPQKAMKAATQKGWAF
jgi:hypothetical protein